VLNLNRLTLLFIMLLSGGCASTPEQPATPATSDNKTQPEQPKKGAPPPTLPSKTSPAPLVVEAATLSDAQLNQLVLKLLPVKLNDKQGWANDLQAAFRNLKVPHSPDNYCAVISIIQQESSFQADPKVPGLPAIVQREIEQRRIKYNIPAPAMNWMLSATSRNGRSYRQRIDTLKTEKELSDLVEEIVAAIPAGGKLFSDYNPVHTGGPMQVSFTFAEAHIRARAYPYSVNGNLRNEVFSRRGGLYFGTAMLLDYPAPYDNIIYRFADYNAGRYSSRNAAFQNALSRISGKALAPDGDLLRYQQGQPVAASSNTQRALRGISNLLQMSDAEIQRDLKLEKFSTFAQTQLYGRVFTLADKNGTQPRVVIPGIALKSPKFTRKLTTAWFAQRVDKRYKSCLKRATNR